MTKALWRARNIAAPKNAQRLGVKTPCAVNGDRCYDCKSPQRICRGLVVLWRPSAAARPRSCSSTSRLATEKEISPKGGSAVRKSSFRFRWRSA